MSRILPVNIIQIVKLTRFDVLWDDLNMTIYGEVL